MNGLGTGMFGIQLRCTYFGSLPRVGQYLGIEKARIVDLYIL